MVKDIVNGSGSGSPTDLTAVGSTLYFEAYDTTNGRALWKSDGTASGTVMVRDIYSGSDTSSPLDDLTAVGNFFYFSADDGTNGTELWKSDGTANGTVMVKDINSGVGDSIPQYLTAIGNTLYFVAYDTTNGYSLWKSDGTANGTIIVKDINNRNDTFNPFNSIKAFGNTLYFSNVGLGTTGYELWKSDGTANGTMLVKDIYNGTGNGYFGGLTAVGNIFYFQATDGTNGQELWKSDGTSAGTMMVKDINNGTGSSSLAQLTAVGNTLFFRANDGTNGTELWKSDGTANGTVMVKDIYNGSTTWVEMCCHSEQNPVGSPVYVTSPNDSNPSHLIAFDNALYFAANNGNNGIELWKSDGTANGTMMVQDIQFGYSSMTSDFGYSSSPMYLTAVGNTLYFRASTHWYHNSDEGTQSVLWAFSL
jgi:ELWxxDGT repeat protein